MIIRKTTAADIDEIVPILDEARRTIASLGINQWQDGYPNRESIEADLAKDYSYVLVNAGHVIGTFALIPDGEPLYDVIENGHWTTGDDSRNYNAVHRVAIAVSSRGSGASTKMVQFAADLSRMAGRASVRIDTHEGNRVMRRMLEKHGFVHCGTIYLANGDPRVAYELVV
ncbi:MAG: GNAT family N-acetyltransferase [Clostridia bacterium]|nr:GNAT family N-acetyltransferase [Clostridia bacterium]